MEMLLIPAIGPNLEQTGISEVQTFPLSSSVYLGDQHNTIGLQYQQDSKSGWRGGWGTSGVGVTVGWHPAAPEDGRS